MKLKLFRIFLITSLFLLIGLAVYFTVLTVLSMIGQEDSVIGDGVLFILCFLATIAVIGLEIGNTIRSVKEGSSFMHTLYVDEFDVEHKKVPIFCTFLSITSIAVIAYVVALLCGVELMGSDWNHNFLRLLIVVFSLIAIDSIFLALYKFVIKFDKPSKK
jgi:hypothetical protein